MARLKKYQTILVTGAPRSGTTAVGNQLGLAEGTATVYEPMNPDSGDRQVTQYFTRPGAGPMGYGTFDDLVHRISSLTLHLKPGNFKHETGLRKIAKIIVGGRSRLSLRRARLTPGLQTLIWKDPIAALAARSAVERHSIPLVITYRPPEAVVASYKRLNWNFPVHRISVELGSANLHGTLLSPNEQSCIVGESAALWSMLYGELLDVAKAFPDRVSIVHMDAVLSDPRATYKQLFDRLGLKFGARADRGISKIEENLGKEFKSNVPSGHPHSQNRNLRAANKYWRQFLTEEELETVQCGTRTVSREFESFLQARGPQVIGG